MLTLIQSSKTKILTKLNPIISITTPHFHQRNALSKQLKLLANCSLRCIFSCSICAIGDTRAGGHCIKFTHPKKNKNPVGIACTFGYSICIVGDARAGKQYWKGSPQDHAVKIPATPPGGYGHTTYNESEPNSGTRVSSSMNPSPSLTLGFNKSSFTYDELAAATNGFDKANMLGQGGFGYVHKGMLPNGKEIAVKRLKSGSGQGEREFQAEVEIISRVHHRHLVSLVGYCSAAGQRMLVYEFVPNNNLEYHLHGEFDFFL